ncbi:hypothetical protein DOH34_25545 [Salmonella enterica subsp. enterica serovar Wangata]|nr:hypothetical protein [Salmonella enterica subsp. enterica serovar Wangata]HER1288893.1 hypothetical protein [Salmonella enterica subsp. enterica serovar Elomrane]
MEEKRRNHFQWDTATPGHELARTYAVNPTTRSHAQFYAKTLALTEATLGLSALSESEFLFEYLKETSLKKLSRITVDTLAIAFLTDASYLKSLEDDIMQNNRLKDSPVDKHVEDEKKKKKAAR